MTLLRILALATGVLGYHYALYRIITTRHATYLRAHYDDYGATLLDPTPTRRTR